MSYTTLQVMITNLFLSIQLRFFDGKSLIQTSGRKKIEFSVTSFYHYGIFFSLLSAFLKIFSLFQISKVTLFFRFQSAFMCVCLHSTLENLTFSFFNMKWNKQILKWKWIEWMNVVYKKKNCKEFPIESIDFYQFLMYMLF